MGAIAKWFIFRPTATAKGHAVTPLIGPAVSAGHLDVAAEPLLTFTRKDYPEAHTGLAKILEAYTPAPRIVGEYDSALSLLAAVEAGRGVALDFETLALLSGERVVFRPVRPAPPSLPLSIAYRAKGISTATSDFVAAARAVKSKQSPQPVLSV